MFKFVGQFLLAGLVVLIEGAEDLRKKGGRERNEKGDIDNWLGRKNLRDSGLCVVCPRL